MADKTMKLSALSDIRAPGPDPGNGPGPRPDPQSTIRCFGGIVCDTIR